MAGYKDRSEPQTVDVDYGGDSHGRFTKEFAEGLQHAIDRGVYIGPFSTAGKMIDHILRPSPRVRSTR